MLVKQENRPKTAFSPLLPAHLSPAEGLVWQPPALTKLLNCQYIMRDLKDFRRHA